MSKTHADVLAALADASDKLTKTELLALLADAKAALTQTIAPKPPAPAPAPATKLLGTLDAKSGVFALIDAQNLDEQWVTQTAARDGYVIDVEGPHAEYLMHRDAGSFKPRQLTATCWRAVASDSLQANALAAQIERHVQTQGWTDQVTSSSSGASKTKAIDAARAGCGAGLVDAGPLRFGGFVVPKGSTVRIEALLGPDGKVRGVQITR
jgi:hypothetical protein